MKDYQDVQLNPYLRKFGSLGEKPSPFFDAYSFDALSDINLIGSRQLGNDAISTENIQDNAITNAKISGFAWSKGSGGTGQFGGSVNAEGVFQILDTAGAVVWQGDSNGVNQDWGTGEYSATTAATTAATVATEIVNATLSGTLTLNTASLVLLYYKAEGYNNRYAAANGTNYGSVIINDGTTALYGQSIGGNFGTSGTPGNEQVAEMFPYLLAAGDHVFNMRFQAVNGGTVTLNTRKLGYVVLGANL